MASRSRAQTLYLRGILLAGAGMVIISPDGMLLHSIDTAPVWDVLFWRTFGLGLTLLLMLCAVYRGRLPALLKAQGWPGLVSACLMAVANLLFVTAMMNTSVANALVLFATMPFWSALLGIVLIGEAVRPRTWIAILVAMSGMAVIMSGSMGGGTLVGDLSALGAAIAHGLNLVVLRKAGDRDMTAALMASGFLTAAVCLPFLAPSQVSPNDWLVLGALGFLILPLALTLFLAGARYAPAAEVALLSLVETVLGPIWAWLVLAEVPDARAFVGGALVIMAVAGNALAGVLARRRRGLSPAQAALAEHHLAASEAAGDAQPDTGPRVEPGDGARDTDHRIL